MGALITQLQREGSLVLFRDYRSGTLRDWSGNGHHGTGSNMALRRGRDGPAAHFADANGYEVVPDSTALRLVHGSILVFADFLKTSRDAGGAGDRLVSKRDGVGGFGYELLLTSTPSVRFYDSSATQMFLLTEYRQSRCVGITFSDGEIPRGYIDSTYAGDFNRAATMSAAATPDLYIGNWYHATRSFQDPARSILICNRVLTDDEIAVVHAEVLG